MTALDKEPEVPNRPPSVRGEPPLWRSNLHVYYSPIQFENRIGKITKSLVTQNIVGQVWIVGIWAEGLAVDEPLDDRRTIHRIRLRIPKVAGNGAAQLLRMAEFSFRTFWFAWRRKVDLVNCRMLFFLPVCVALKYLRRTTLVYDAHEIESEQEGFQGWRKRLLQFVERRLVKCADLMIIAGRSYADWYEREYGLSNVGVLNNVPPRGNPEPIVRQRTLREPFGIGEDELLFIYQGLLVEERGILLLLRAFAACPDKSRHIVFMGFGPLQELVEAHAREHRNIHFHPAVPAAKIKSYTCSADVGFSAPLHTSLNNYLCNPNKTYEYLLAGVPMIVSNFPELTRFVAENQCGWVVEPEERTIADLIARISPTEIAVLRRNIAVSRLRHGWENEEENLVRYYHDLARRRGLQLPIQSTA